MRPLRLNSYPEPATEILDLAQLQRENAEFLDHWVWTAGELSNLRNENRSLRLALTIAMRVLGAEEIRACLTDTQREAVDSIEAPGIPTTRYGH